MKNKIKELMSNIPKGQEVVLQYYQQGELKYLITQHEVTKIYTLFSVDNSGKIQKCKTSKTPIAFKEVYP